MAALLASCALLVMLLPAWALCPERCDCQHSQHLLCTNRGLQSVPTSPEQDSEDVVVLSLGGNFIRNISAQDFQRFSRLLRLDLQYNQIQTLHPRAFEKLARLEELYLGNNLLSSVSSGTFQSLKKLRILYANHNAIQRLPSDCFANLETLVKLRLDGNAMEMLPDAAFQSMPNLLYLHLESNNLRVVHRHAFTNLERLRFLNLSGNRQKMLRNGLTFASLSSLTTLLICENEIQQLGEHIFRNLKKLSKLALSNNKISMVDQEALKGLSALRELSMDGNLLTVIPAFLLDPLEMVEVLDFSRNRIAQVDPSAFKQLKHLKELKLNDNWLSSISGDIFSLNSVLFNLDLNGNNWTCDCRLLDFKEWTNLVHSQGRLLGVFVQCQHPVWLKSKYLDYVNDSQLLRPGDGSQTCDTRGSRESVLGGVMEKPFPGMNVQGDQGRMGRGMVKSRVVEDRKRKTGNRSKPKSHSLSTKSPSLGSNLKVEFSTVLPLDNSERFDRLQQDEPGVPVVSDACQFNRYFIANVTAGDVSSSTANIRWTTREHRRAPATTIHFRVLYDRFGQMVRFPRFVHVRDGGQGVTLQELSHDTTYVVCVEGVVGGAVCQVASRDHCTGVVTPQDRQSRVDLQMVTVAMLGVNALLLLLVGGVWFGRTLRRRLRRRRSSVHVRRMYSTRRPLRTMAASISNDFTSYQSSRMQGCTLDEGDLIQFPCDHFLDNGTTRREDILQRFPD